MGEIGGGQMVEGLMGGHWVGHRGGQMGGADGGQLLSPAAIISFNEKDEELKIGTI